MRDGYAAAPQPAHRLIPSRFPPIGLFDTVATAADLPAALALVGWTNDRLVADRLDRLPQAEWVYGRANSSIVMAAFLHPSLGGSRFNGPDLGAWYASAAVRTAAIEVAHHLRREAVARGVPEMQRQFRGYTAQLAGEYRDIRGQQCRFAAAYAPTSFTASQHFGERLRATGNAGIIYESLRHAGGINVEAYRPHNVLDVVQADPFAIHVRAATRRIDVRKLRMKEGKRTDLP